MIQNASDAWSEEVARRDELSRVANEMGATFGSDGVDTVDNAFCATGDGGGVDPSCGASLKAMVAAGPASMTYEGIDVAVDKLLQSKGAKFREAVIDAFGEHHGDSILKAGRTKTGVVERIRTALKERLGSHERTAALLKSRDVDA